MARTPRTGAREALLDAARDEFARSGLEGARVEDIARRAGISKGAFYLHFATKTDAFREIVFRFLGALEDHALRRSELEERSALRPAPLDEAGLRERIEVECAIDVDLLDVLWRNRQILAAVEGATGKLYRELVGDFRRKMRALVSGRVLDGLFPGARVRADVAPDVVADIVVGTYEDFARRMIDMREKPDLEKWARSLLLVIYEGILLRPGAPPRRAARTPARTRTFMTTRSPHRRSR